MTKRPCFERPCFEMPGLISKQGLSKQGLAQVGISCDVRCAEVVYMAPEVIKKWYDARQEWKGTFVAIAKRRHGS